MLSHMAGFHHFMAKYYSIIDIPYIGCIFIAYISHIYTNIFFIQLPVEGHLVWFISWQCRKNIPNSTEVTMRCRCLFNTLTSFPLGIYLWVYNYSSETAISHGSSFLSFLRQHHAVIDNGFTNLHSHIWCIRAPLSPSPQ
jgi:hypothetical protein